jgi:hypothetical protein
MSDKHPVDPECWRTVEGLYHPSRSTSGTWLRSHRRRATSTTLPTKSATPSPSDGRRSFYRATARRGARRFFIYPSGCGFMWTWRSAAWRCHRESDPKHPTTGSAKAVIGGAEGCGIRRSPPLARSRPSRRTGGSTSSVWTPSGQYAHGVELPRTGLVASVAPVAAHLTTFPNITPPG